jgi:cytoskeletal protein CcmA (bactofilin family)
MSKTRLSVVIFSALFLIFGAVQVKAFNVKNQDSVYVGKDEVISSTFFAAGSSITIDGKVQGDVVCAGRSIVINGFVDGDVLCAGQSIVVNGEVRGNVRAVGSSVTVNGKVARNVMAAGSDVTLGSQAEVGWDMMFAAAFSDIRGNVKRDLDGAGSMITVGSVIGRNVNLFSGDGHDRSNKNTQDNKTQNITITKEAVINGDLAYKSVQEAKVEEGATIKGASDHQKITMGQSKKDSGENLLAGYIWWRIIVIFAALLVGLLLVSVFKRPLMEISQKMFNKPYATLGYGLLLIIVTPIICGILMVTLIGIPVALISMALWLILLYVGKLVTAILVGTEILKRRKTIETKTPSLVTAMVVGVIVTYLIFSIPVIGGFLSMLATIFGIGLVWQYCRMKSVRSEV